MAPAIDLRDYRSIVVLTGAGVSAASGLQTFRGPNGLWEEEEELAALAHASAFRANPQRAWRLFGRLREAANAATPNAAHLALAAVERQLRTGQSFLLATQNVDGLHGRAGSRRVLELHGSLFRTRCPQGDSPTIPDPEPHLERAPTCPRCGAVLRPDVVLFDEPLDAEVERAVRHSLRDCDLFVAVGTSGTVTPAANYVRSAAHAGARTVLVNLEPMEPPNPYFQEQHLGRAEELLPELLLDRPS